MATKKPLIAEAFTNDFGTANVGDTVMVVTTGYSHRVSVYKAQYLGYIESEGWRGDKIKKVKVGYEASRHVPYWKETGKKFNWNTDYNAATYDRNKIEYREEKYPATSTLQLNRIAPIKASEHAVVDTIGKLV